MDGQNANRIGSKIGNRIKANIQVGQLVKKMDIWGPLGAFSDMDISIQTIISVSAAGRKCFRPGIARRFQFRHPFVAPMSRFCAIRGTSDFSQLICCNLDPTDKKRTCSAHLGNIWMPEMESLGDLRSNTLCLTCLFGWSSAVMRLLATLQCESTEHMSSLERENRRRIGVPG